MVAEILRLLKSDIADMVRARDKDKLLALRTLLVEIKNVASANNNELHLNDLETIISRAVQQRSQALESYRKNGRLDLLAKEEAELELIKRYLPRPLEPFELEAIARGCIAELGACGSGDIGRVLEELMPKVQGRANIVELSQIVTKLLEPGTMPTSPATR